MAQNITTEERAVSLKGPILNPFMDLHFFILYSNGAASYREIYKKKPHYLFPLKIP